MARLNPLRHGVLSQAPVIPLVEREEDWEGCAEGCNEFFGVQGLPWPEALADRLAGLYWRCLRVQRYETEAISSYLYEVPRDWRELRAAVGLPAPEDVTPEAVMEMDAMLMARLLPSDEILDKVLRYETKLHRFLLQTEHQLLVLMGVPGVTSSALNVDRPPQPRPKATKRVEGFRPDVRPRE